MLLNKACQCVVRRKLFSESSQPEFSPARRLDGVSIWEMAKADKVSEWKAVPLIKGLLHVVAGWGPEKQDYCQGLK